MKSETIKVRMENGGMLDVAVFSKRVGAIQVIVGEGAHSTRCELTPTRNGLAYAGNAMGRELVYERSRDEVQADLERATASRPSRPR